MNLKCQFKIRLNHFIILTHYFQSTWRVILSFFFFILMNLLSTVTDDLVDISFKLSMGISLADLIFLTLEIHIISDYKMIKINYM